MLAKVRHRTWTLALAASLGLAVACSEKQTGIAGANGQKETDASKKGSTRDDRSGGKSYDDDDDELDSIDDDDGGTGGGPNLEEVLKECGVDLASLEDPDAVLMNKQVRSWPKVFYGTESKALVGDVNFRVTIITKIQVKATMSEVRQTTDFDVQATPSAALGPAEEKVEPNRGTSRSFVLNTEERSELMSSNDQWSGIVCTIQPVKELETTKGGFVKRVKFDPPLPGSVSPKADPKRYAAEIGEAIGSERVFTGIQAEIIRSNDPAFPQGKKLTGTVRVKRVRPVLTLKIGQDGGETRELRADAAFRIETEFESVEGTVGVGLMPSQTLYIVHGDRDVRYIVANTGFKEGGIVVLSDQF